MRHALCLCCLSLAGIPLPAGSPLPAGCPHNAQAHRGGKGDAHTKGKHCRAAGKENTLCAVPKRQLGQAIADGSAGQEYPSPTPLGTMCTPTGGSLRSQRPGWSLWQRRTGTSRVQFAAGGKVSTCSTTHLLGFSSQQEELRALSFSLPQPCEALSLFHGIRDETGAQRG